MGNPAPRRKRKTRNQKPAQPALFETAPTEDEKTSEENQTEQEERTETNMLTKFYQKCLQGKSAAWTAIFTCVLSFFSWLLYEVSKQATEASIASQRAFISFAGVAGLEKIFSGGPPGKNTIIAYDFHTPMGNSGTTAAKYSMFEISRATLESAPTTTTDFDSLPHSERHRYVFGPKAMFDGSPLRIPIGELISLEQSKKHIVIWGWNVYRDIFLGSPAHLSEFCVDVTNPRWNKIERDDPTTELKVDTPPCDTHNCYDEDCPDYSVRIRDTK